MIFKTDANGDLAVENGSWVLLEGQAEIAQNMAERYRMFLGEWFLDQREGIPYFEHILRKISDPVVVDTIFKRTAILTPGVVQLLEFLTQINRATRQLTVTLKAQTIDGILTVEDFEVP
jgi:hypothetical protein